MQACSQVRTNVRSILLEIWTFCEPSVLAARCSVSQSPEEYTHSRHSTELLNCSSHFSTWWRTPTCGMKLRHGAHAAMPTASANRCSTTASVPLVWAQPWCAQLHAKRRSTTASLLLISAQSWCAQLHAKRRSTVASLPLVGLLDGGVLPRLATHEYSGESALRGISLHSRFTRRCLNSGKLIVF